MLMNSRERCDWRWQSTVRSLHAVGHSAHTAAVLGISQLQVSALLRYELDEFTAERLITLARLATSQCRIRAPTDEPGEQ